MPVQIQMAEPADLAGIYTRGVQTRAEIQAAQQRLQQQAADTQARLQAAAAENAREAAVEQQRIRVTEAYQQQQIGLRKRELDEAAAVNQQKTLDAARQFEARQEWQKGFDQIDSNPALTPEQKDAEKTRFTMRLAPMMGMPGTQAASMLRELRPEKATVPAKVEDKGDFLQITQPTGAVTIRNKPRDVARETSQNVKVVLEAGSPPVTMSKSQALQAIPRLDPEIRVNPINQAVIRQAVADQQKSVPPSQAAVGGTAVAPQATPAQGQRVRVIRPDGQVGTIDSSKLDAALKSGYKRAE